MFKTWRYYWKAARGYRFNPWKSPYLRWRFETFLGNEAANLTASKFFRLSWKYRDEAANLTASKFFRLSWKYRDHMERFVDWAAERERFQRRRHA